MSKVNKRQPNDINKKVEDKKAFRVALVYALVFALALIVFGVTGTYAFYNIQFEKSSTTSALNASAACFNVSLTADTALSLGQYNYPITDNWALDHITPATVSVQNTCAAGTPAINYSLYLTTINGYGGTILDTKLKVRVLKGSAVVAGWDTALLSAKTTNVIQTANVPEALKKAVVEKNANLGNNGVYRLIESSSVAGNTTNIYKVYLWIDYGATTTDVANKNFSSLVSAVIN